MHARRRMVIWWLRVHARGRAIWRHRGRTSAQNANDFRQRILNIDLSLPYIGDLSLKTPYASADAQI